MRKKVDLKIAAEKAQKQYDAEHPTNVRPIDYASGGGGVIRGNLIAVTTLLAGGAAGSASTKCSFEYYIFPIDTEGLSEDDRLTPDALEPEMHNRNGLGITEVGGGVGIAYTLGDDEYGSPVYRLFAVSGETPIVGVCDCTPDDP